MTGVTDCHLHVNPLWEMRADARALLGPLPGDADRFLRDPSLLLAYLDRAGVDRAVLVNYVAPEVIGYTERTNDFVAEYVRAHRRRLIGAGGIRIPFTVDPEREVARLVDELGLRAVKLHPPHQRFYPNAYGDDSQDPLRRLYAALERRRVPVIFHTGTSIFPGARNKYGAPMFVEDVAIDFPKLPIVLAHAGRPLWTDEAEFLHRRFPNVWLELSGIPPARILNYLPRLEQRSERVVFGTDWPGPGVPSIRSNLDAFRALPLSSAVKERILVTNALELWP